MQPRQKVFDAFCVCSSQSLPQIVNRSVFVFVRSAFSTDSARHGPRSLGLKRRDREGRARSNVSWPCQPDCRLARSAPAADCAEHACATIEISQNCGDTAQLLHAVQERRLGSCRWRQSALMRVACVDAPRSSTTRSRAWRRADRISQAARRRRDDVSEQGVLSHAHNERDSSDAALVTTAARRRYRTRARQSHSVTPAQPGRQAFEAARDAKRARHNALVLRRDAILHPRTTRVTPATILTV